MEATRRLEVELPEGLAAYVEAEVESGRFADISEAAASALVLMREQDEDRDPEIEAWLKEVVVPRYRAWDASGKPGLSIEEARASLARRRAERLRPDAAE